MCRCGNEIEQARLDLNLKTCKRCAFKGPDVNKYKGNMIWQHKTGAEIQVMSNSCYESQKKYFKPNGCRSSVKNFSKNICS